MTTGTKIIEKALSLIGAHSALNKAGPESIEAGKDTLNSMIAEWQDEGIDFGAVPLDAAGDELSEPLGVRNTIEANLAIKLHSLFPGAALPQLLIGEAKKGLNKIKRIYRPIAIPKPQARGTLPAGQGNTGRTFFKEGSEIG